MSIQVNDGDLELISGGAGPNARDNSLLSDTELDSVVGAKDAVYFGVPGDALVAKMSFGGGYGLVVWATPDNHGYVLHVP
jgi:hypothetical protein